MLELLQEEDFIKIFKMQGRKLFFCFLLPWADNMSGNCSFHVHSWPLPYVSLPYVTICFIKCMVVFLWMQPYVVSSLLKMAYLLQVDL